MKKRQTFFRRARLFIITAFLMMVSNTANAQLCGGSGCASTDYANFGFNSNSNASSIEYDNFVSGFHSTVIRTADGKFQVWGANSTATGTNNYIPSEINVGNFPLITNSTPLKVTIGSSNIGAVMFTLLTTNGLYKWGKNSTAIAMTKEPGTGLPTGVNPMDVKIMTATHQTLTIVTCSGDVWVKTDSIYTANAGAGSSASAGIWYKVTTNAAGAPLQNIIALRISYQTLFALKSDGTLWTWGEHTYKGDGGAKAANNRAVQMTLPNNPGGTIKMIALTRQGNLTSAPNAPTYYVLYTDGNLYSVGGNSSKQLGAWIDPNVAGQTLSWVQPRYNSSSGPVMNNIKWISANGHDVNVPAINVINNNGTLYNWGLNAAYMLGRPSAGSTSYDPGIPGGLTTSDKILSVTTGGHTTMIIKLNEPKMGYVGHYIDGSPGNGTQTEATIEIFQFVDTQVKICGLETPLVQNISGCGALDLNTAIQSTNVKPSDAEIRWFNGDNPATATQITNITAVAPGTYYAFYYYSTTNSYSPASAPVVATSTAWAGAATANQTIASGTAPTALTLTGSLGTIQWQVSTDNITFTNVAGAGTTASYSPGILTATRYYRAVVTSGTCVLNSNVITITITCIAGTTAPTLAAGTTANYYNSLGYAIPCGSTTANLSGIIATNNPLPGTLTLTWHSGSPATNLNKITNVSALTGSTKYYAAFFDATGNCYSPTKEIVVFAPICAEDDDFTATPIISGLGGTLPSIYANDSYNGVTITSLVAVPVQWIHEIWEYSQISTINDNGTIVIPAGLAPGIYTNYYKLRDKDSDIGTKINDSEVVSVTFRVVLDIDGDGLHDEIDVDDDNDGILDTVEGFCESQTVYTMDLTATLASANASFNANGSTFDLVYNLTSGPAVTGIGTTFNVPFSYSDFRNTTILVDQRWEGFNVAGNTIHIRPVTSQLYSNLPVSNSTNETYNTAQSPDWNFKNWLNTTVIDKLGTFTTSTGALPVPANHLSTYSSRTPLNLYSTWNLNNNASSTGGYYAYMQLQSAIGTGSNTISPPYDSSYGRSYIWDFTAFNSNPTSNSPGNEGNRGLITITQNAITFCNHKDTDGDGIPDYIDLDSDADGCADAIEGGANITITDLVTAGGTVTGGSTTVNKNLCATSACVSSSGTNIGLPQFSTLPTNYSNATGQSLGDSQNNAVNNCITSCTKPGNFPSVITPNPTKVGITVQQKKAGWPENINNGFLALESKTKGFVITRVATVGDNLDGTPTATDSVADPKEGMLVYDIADSCTKLFSSGKWKCIAKSCNN